ncbi:hypothetical protein H0I23_07910 [Cellulophaga sp. HaHaR_3_176]|uniref:DUF4331 domain-containing protein n=1 Tax=Cellulophaga sp. HaHaR_3_176 TaxID=1942464 RepID=UPI001C1F499C|nr:DUF4331 domain-containing protein [Cellulophaga sp. HaHaR_3_176]QWX85553.1 hypothetical protein H0I23_07910 [Cellulophaga sp. HaHaR_3_176]
MKLSNIFYAFSYAVALTLFVSCDNDDDNVQIIEEEEMEMMADFSGTYIQADHMGRPGVNTVLSGDDATKDMQNVTIPSEMGAAFQASFEARLEGLHDAYAVALGFTPADVDYQNNILGLDIATLTGYLAADVLEVAPNNVTTYFLPGEDADMDGNVLNDPAVIGLTGRTIQDDVIDVSLILFFGGEDGIRFSGQDTDNDGVQDLPRLTSDGVSITANPTSTFPYLGNPE